MEWQIRPSSLALLAVGVVLLGGAALGLFTGNPSVLTYAVPAALAGLAVTFLAVRLLERDVEAATGG